ncbi:MAG: rhodanese-like domain-containing protein [Janthinobacterium lividum]
MNKTVSPETVRQILRDGREIALIDLREEGPYSRAHPLFAVNVPLSRIELLTLELVPRSSVPIVLYGGADGLDHLVARALPVFRRLGYSDVSVLEGGLDGWRSGGGELFQDVNVPSKAFGELVEATCHTPSLAAEELHRRLAEGDNLVVLDARRTEEFAVMSIPSGQSVPGGELALRVRDVAPDPHTVVVVNCAGRTRSIIGTQSLVNAGIPNPVFALRNGTIGWTLAGLALDRDATRRTVAKPMSAHVKARAAAALLAERTGVRVLDLEGFRALESRSDITLYWLDVRSPDEHAAGHPQGFRNAPGGQLVQATDEWIGVRHGTIVLIDDDGVRARMAGHWLRQLGWNEVFVLDGWDGLVLEQGRVPSRVAEPPRGFETIAPSALAVRLEAGDVLLIDLARSPDFRRAHIPGARFAVRAELSGLDALVAERTLVLTSPDGVLAAFVAADVQASTGRSPLLLAGGTDAWRSAGFPVETGLAPGMALSVPDDVYKRPYEGTDNDQAAMQAYLDWEFGLVAQLERDGTHGFRVLS